MLYFRFIFFLPDTQGSKDRATNFKTIVQITFCQEQICIIFVSNLSTNSINACNTSHRQQSKRFAVVQPYFQCINELTTLNLYPLLQGLCSVIVFLYITVITQDVEKFFFFYPCSTIHVLIVLCSSNTLIFASIFLFILFAICRNCVHKCDIFIILM